MKTTLQPGRVSRLLAPIPTKDLAKATDRSYQAAGFWKSGETLPGPELLPAIAEVAGIPLRELRDAYSDDRAARRQARATGAS